jgi:hypothetical protein
MTFVPANLKKKSSGKVTADEWNSIVDELVDLRAYANNMSRCITLLSPPSIEGAPLQGLDTSSGLGYGSNAKVMGLVSGQYYRKNKGTICKFGLYDFADAIYYWAAAETPDKMLRITLNYRPTPSDIKQGKMPPSYSEEVFIHDWKNPATGNCTFVDQMNSAVGGAYIYEYKIDNPPGNSVRQISDITFEDNKDLGVSVFNAIQYVTKSRPLQDYSGIK